MSTALVERPQDALVAQTDPDFWETMQHVVTTGDLSSLSSENKTKYYRYVAESVGLNAATLPFGYIKTKSGAVTLYANRNATDQLRKIHHINAEIVQRERSADERGNPVYLVMARATMPDGRQEESIALVPISGLGGEDYCNALMKCETKAKRRVTLSAVGLSLMDETEADSIAGARRFTPAEFERPDFALPADASTPTTPPPPPPVASNVHQQAEVRRLADGGFPIARELAMLGLESIDDLDAESAKGLIVAGRTYLRRGAGALATPPVASPPIVEHVVPDAPFVLSATQISLFWATGVQEGWSKGEKRKAMGELYPDRVEPDGTVSIKSLSRDEFDGMIALFEDRLALGYDGDGKAILKPSGPPAEDAGEPGE